MKGYSKSYTYLKYLERLELVKINKKIKDIEEQLHLILDMFVKKHKNKKYEHTGKFSYKFIKTGTIITRLWQFACLLVHSHIQGKKLLWIS